MKQTSGIIQKGKWVGWIIIHKETISECWIRGGRNHWERNKWLGERRLKKWRKRWRNWIWNKIRKIFIRKRINEETIKWRSVIEIQIGYKIQPNDLNSW